MKNYNFSVVIPCYNLGKLVENAVNSVLSQSLGNVEVIVVDDCSTDDFTIKVLKKLESKIKIIYQKKNGGVSVARNTGVSVAGADYVLCLDADDSIESTYLEKAKNIFDNNKDVGIVTCHLRAHGEFNWVSKAKKDITIVDALIGSPVHTASCFRKEAWLSAGGYNEKMRGFEDWDFWIGIIKNDWKIGVIEEFLFNYLTRPDSKVKTSSKNAEELTSIIINHHRDVFEKYYDKVIAKKHAKIEELIAHVNNFNKISFKNELNDNKASTDILSNFYFKIINMKNKWVK